MPRQQPGGALDVLQGISVFVGAHAFQLLEGPGKVGSICIAHHFADVADFQAGIPEKLLGLLNPDAVEDVIEALFRRAI